MVPHNFSIHPHSSQTLGDVGSQHARNTISVNTQEFSLIEQGYYKHKDTNDNGREEQTLAGR